MPDLKKLLPKWKKIKCWLTGGHRYDSGEIRSHRIPERSVTCFIHRCVKCGEYSVYVVKDRALYGSLYDFDLGVSDGQAKIVRHEIQLYSQRPG